MKCDFCGFTFEEQAAKKGCGGCPMSKNCNKIKCPNCNYEMVGLPEWKLLNKIVKWSNEKWKR